MKPLQRSRKAAPIHAPKPLHWTHESVAASYRRPASRLTNGRRVTPKRSPNRRIRRSWHLFVLAFLATLVFWATHCQYFTVQKVMVEGNWIVARETILKTAQVLPGSNLWLVSARAVRGRLTSIPAIEDVSIIREFPHSVVLSVTERRPWAVVQWGSQSFYMDSALRVIGETAHPALSLPEVLADRTAIDAPIPGSTISDRLLLSALQCLRMGEDAGYQVGIIRVFIDAQRNIWLNVRGFGKVMIGQPTTLGQKLATLRNIVRGKLALSTRSRILDLQNPATPAYVPAAEPDPQKSVIAARPHA